MLTSWQFDLNRDGSSEGWEDAAIKNFRGNPLNNLAREVIQNSLDAPKANSDGVVTVSFQKETVKTKDVPNIKELRATLDKCLKAADTFVLPDKQENLVLAKAMIAASSIDILKITETGTAGMEGPCEPGKPLYKYMKAKGQGGKSFDGARGSHGQGKAAPILCSQLHTIFVSTKWKRKNLVMGRATLSSHYGKTKKEIHNNVGYWGRDFEPVEFEETLPAWLERDNPGTNIIVLGFKDFSNWNEILIAAVATTFFAAIDKGLLKVIVQNFEINRETLPNIFKKQSLVKLVEAQSDVPRGDFERANGYYEAYTTPDYKAEGEVLNLGFFNFFIKEREDDQQNIGMLRDDMFITSSIPRLKRKFGSSFNGFDLVIEPASASSRLLIKYMEPPAHDGLNISWIDDEQLKNKTESGMSHLRKRVIELLERHLKIETGNAQQHDVFDKYFSVSGGGEQISDATDPTGGFVFSNRQISERFQSNAAILSSDWSHDLEDGEPEQNDENQPSSEEKPKSPQIANGSEVGSEPTPKESQKSISDFGLKPVDLKNVKMRSLSGSVFMVQFTPEKTGHLKVLFAEQGSDLKTLMKVKESSQGNVSDDGALFIYCEQGAKVRLEITLNKTLSGALSLLASGA
jgi:hypothetical protein